MSAAIAPTTPIAAIPEGPSISGTPVGGGAYALTVEARRSAIQSQILVIVNPPYLRLRRSQRSAAIEPTTPIAAKPEVASISGTGVA
jgi:hypothetical protein